LQALFSNTTGFENTAAGFEALFSNTTGINNTANGSNALLNNTIGRNNTAEGLQALNNNTMGINNTGVGVNALFSNTTGNLNVALGVNSLLRNTTGSSNIALGVNAGGNLTIGNSNIDIGNAGVAAEANTTRVGTQGTQRRAFIAGISGTAVTGSPVVVNASGQLGVAASSERFKDEIKPMNNVSEAILALQPVTFRYKKTIDPDRVPQFGLVADEVAKVNPDLVARDAKGEVYTVRYEAVNAMLLNEFLKEHRKNEEQEKTIAELKSGMTALAATVKAQASQIQKVSAQLEASKPAPQVVNNP
jgi:endosialidase-like protein